MPYLACIILNPDCNNSKVDNAVSTFSPIPETQQGFIISNSQLSKGKVSELLFCYFKILLYKIVYFSLELRVHNLHYNNNHFKILYGMINVLNLQQ